MRSLVAAETVLPEAPAPELTAADEQIFAAPIGKRIETSETVRVDRAALGGGRGYHVGFDYPTRLDLDLRVTEITYKVETLTDMKTGRSLRADTTEHGPAGFRMTWNAIAIVINLIVGFAIPVNRVAKMIGVKGFSSGKMCRVLAYVAKELLPIYIYLAEALAEAKILSGDDTHTKVLEVGEPSADKKLGLTHKLDERFGWHAPRLDGKGDKTSLNVSLIMGRIEAFDPLSTVCFFRTHFGNVGNLLTMLLESRSPRSGPLIFQGDLSTANLPSRATREIIKLIVAGCGAHARRPFWRYRGDDPDLCYYMLRGFALLAALEARIDREGRTKERTLRLRGRYGRMIWQALKNRCIAAIIGHLPTIATRPKGYCPPLFRWPKKTDLYIASNYVINHFDELTRYLRDPRLEYTNNRRERGLRAETYMLLASKFRKTRNGRAALDILRTINATCTAAGIDLADYLRYVFRHRGNIADHPELYTPHAVAIALAAKSKTAPAAA